MNLQYLTTNDYDLLFFPPPSGDFLLSSSILFGPIPIFNRNQFFNSDF